MAIALLLALALDGTPAEVAFARQVLPALQAKCLPCHGGGAPRKLEGGLDLSSRAALLKGGDNGPSIVPGDPAKSLLFRAAIRTDADVAAMPPKENDKLAAAEVAAFKEWLAGGAPWPDEARIAALNASAPTTGVALRTSGGLSKDWTERRYQPADLWAYQPLKKPAVPPGSANPVDAFLNAKRTAMGLAAAPPADRRALLRRVTFDLTGLPPLPREINAFAQDPAPDDAAFARVVDRLLASPHYGEQLARHWLDVVRYADSAGLANDYERGNAWRYRDYVVRSFNADKSYDRFVQEQIAGDELDPANPELLVATGFLRMGAWELTGMEVPKLARQRFLDDVTDGVGQTFLGHMLQCARCHDHKFDPVPTRDYYSFQAAFATTQLAERPAAFLPSENRGGFAERRWLERRKAHLEAELAGLQSKEAAARAAWEKTHPNPKGRKPARTEYLAPEDLGRERIARKGLERLKWEFDRYEPYALAVYSGHTKTLKAVQSPLRMPKDLAQGELEATAILAGGDPFSPTTPVKPAVLSAVGGPALPDGVAGRRQALAAWIVAKDNPLAARVMANRVWQWTFGRPLAGNPNNFGATGQKPTHPELLDWLAATFVEEGWSVKSLQRRLLLSAAYRRSSRHPDPAALATKDPLGTSYAAFAPRRLAAEELRDAMLATAGLLDRTLGGIPVRPELEPEIAFQPRQVMGTFAPAWEPSPRPSQRHRRTLYALKLRGLRDPLQEAFNAPSPELPCERRETATVAPQALTLLNGPASRAAALAFAHRLLKETADRPAAIDHAFRLAFGRAPSAAERQACLDHWQATERREANIRWTKPSVPRELLREAVEENTGVRFRFREPLFLAEEFVPDRHPADASPAERGLMDVALMLLNANEFAYLD